MFVFFTSVGLMFGLLGSVFVGIGQINFFNGWVCLELNMLMFLALMGILEKSAPSASMKYFIVQSIGSSVFLWAVGLETAGFGSMSEAVMGGALSLKLGIAPFQSWFVSVLSTMGWELVFMASTLQKVLPVFLMSSLKLEPLILAVGGSVVVSLLGSINQTFLKKILAYSSVFMTIWLIICEGEMDKSLEYLMAYSGALGVVISVFAALMVEEIGEVLSGMGNIFTGVTMSGFLSMSGCPPFIGFYAKISVITGMLGHSQLFWSLVLVLSSVFLLYVYMRMFYFSLSFSGSQWGTLTNMRSPSVMVLVLWGVLLLPWFLCLGVTHGKFWTFSA